MGGHECFLLRDGYAECKAECKPGKDGWCTGHVHEKPVEAYPGTSLFCFGFYMANTGSTKKSYDLELFRAELAVGASIFGCPKWQGYSDVDTWLSQGPPLLKTTKVDDVDGDFHLFKRKRFGTWINAMMFYQAWMDMRRNKLTETSDWVVKVDLMLSFFQNGLQTCCRATKFRKVVSTWRTARRSCLASSAILRWCPMTVSTLSSTTSKPVRRLSTGRA